MQNGWVKSIDPKTGRAFYANHVTRKTQWDPPPGWVEPQESSAPLPPPSIDDHFEDENEPLPDNWEVMHDPTTGKPFYVDHERKITQWTRPKIEKKAAARPMSFAPAATTTTTSTSAAMARILRATGGTSSTSHVERSYSEEANYFQHSHSGVSTDVDFSDSMPALDFSVKKVADKYRLECPHCDALFTLSKRRHHCRLCGDIFCDACSSHRVELPLPGPEFEKPVRICDFCNEDVSQGNFFSLRRYLTPLTLYDPDTPDDDNEDGAATPSNVNAALAALTSDLNQLMQNSEGFEEKVTIPPEILVPAILKHLSQKSNTSNRAIRAVASLLSMGGMVGKQEYAHAVYLYGGRKTLDSILTILERSGSDRKTLFVQEKAAEAMFYLTDATTLSTLMQKHSEVSLARRKSGDDDDDEELGDLDSLDIQRALRNFLDHASNSKNPNLQRWSAATVRNLILEDQRRACLAINDVAARVASGEPASGVGYESLLDDLIQTGGIMILCSLIGADDSDTRAHATAALGATISATRSIDEAFASLYEMTGGAAGKVEQKDGDIVRAITAGGGCGSSVSQLLLSAENSVASMGCAFLASLVLPLLLDPEGCATLHSHYDYRTDQSGLGACREAAIEIASGSCLPALESLVRENGRATRPIELRKMAMETLAATVLAVGEMGKSWAGGKYEEGMERNGAPATLTRSLNFINEEMVIDVALGVLKSTSSQSLGSSNDTPASRIRESAGIILGTLTSCSAEAIMELHSRQELSSLIQAANDSSMTAPSTLRGDAAPKCLGMLEAASSVLMFTWQHPSGASSELLDRLIEVLDAGAITYLYRVMNSSMDWDSRDKSSGGMKARSSACQLLCCLFGIALTDETAIGMRRLMDSCDADQAQRRVKKGPRNIMESVLTVLQTSLNYAHKMMMGGTNKGPHYQAALMDLVESSILATGSMCGSSIAPGGGDGTMIKGDAMLAMRADEFENRRKEVCKVACDIVIRGGRNGPALLPTLLVGGFGEGSVTGSLRLALAIAQNGSEEQHSKLATSGLLVPVSDLLKSSLTAGDLYKFSASLALVRFCGPYVAAGTSGGVQSVRDAIRVATKVLTLPISPGASVEQIETQEALKSECISALEAVSQNAALWSAISTDALPSIVAYLHSSCDPGSGGVSLPETRSSALRAVLQIVQVPSHAVSAAQAGLAEPLARMLKSSNALHARAQDVDENMQLLAIEVLHVLVSRPESRRHCQLLQGDTLRAVCAAIGFTATDNASLQSDARANLTVIGLEILHYALAEVGSSGDTASILQSAGAIAFLDAVASEPRLVRSLCATLLLKTDMKITNHESEEGSTDVLDVPQLYGPPVLLVKEKCAGFDSTHDASAAVLFATSVFACAIESHKSEAFWKHALLQDLHNVNDVSECLQASSTFCAIYLRLLTEEYIGFVPRDPQGKQDYENLTRPLIRYRLLETLKTSLDELTTESVLGHTEIDVYMLSLLVHFNVPHICLSVWKDPALLELSYGLIKAMVEADPDEVLHLFVESKDAIMSLFDLLNIDQSTDAVIEVAEIQRFLATTLEKLAQSGMLTEAVEKFGVRSSAIAALAAACLSEQEEAHDDEEELTSNRLASGLMQTLVELCTVSKSNDSSKSIELSPGEAVSIAKTLGKKICQMVMTRFLERAKLQEYEIEEDENIMDAPDVAMLCAIAQHDSALQVLRSIGGLHAIAQVAGEGEITAVLALKNGCKEDPSLLLEGETFAAILSLFSTEKGHAHWRAEKESQSKVETAAFELLAQLCMSSSKGRAAVATSHDFEHALNRGLDIVAKVIPSRTEDSVPTTTGNEITDDEADNATTDSKSESEDLTEEVVEEKKEATSTEIVSPTTVSTSVEDPKLLAAAYSFLSAMTPVPSARKALLENGQFIQATSALLVDDTDSNLQFAALRAIAKLAPYSSGDGSLTASSVGELLKSALAAEPEIPTTGNFGWNKNLYHIQAAEGVFIVFDSLPQDKQKEIFMSVTSRYVKLLKSHSIARTTNASERANGGELAYNLTTLMMVARGKDCIMDCFDVTLITSLVNTVQWRYDPKTIIPQEELDYWMATTTQCLQIVAQSLYKEEASLIKAGIKIKSLKDSVFMVARPGKAPRKAIDFPSALRLVAKSGEAAAKVAAERILSHLIE